MKDCWNWWNWKKANCKHNKLWNQPKLIKNNFDQWMTPQKFQESDLVMVYDNHHDRKTFKKFLKKWFGPYMVVKVFSDNNTYELVHLHGEKYGKINHDKLKHFHTA